MIKNDNSEKIACVTGASGIVGRRIVQSLTKAGYHTRVLSRKKTYIESNVELFNGGIEDECVLKKFILDAHLLFHCAAELHDKTKMWDVNVLGTKRLLGVVKGSNIQYFCYLSSAGVVGKTNTKCVDETTECNPQNTYEQSKWEAERLVSQGVDGCSVLILRPTNIVDEEQIGAIGLSMKTSRLSRFKFFFKGGECAHIVHAKDVADVAMYFTPDTFKKPQCYFVSRDHEPFNTFAGLKAIYTAIERNHSPERIRLGLQLPIIIPYYFRKIWRGRSNLGNVRYSSEKLLSKGFKFGLSIEEMIKQTINTQSRKPL